MKSPIVGIFVILVAFLALGCARSSVKAADGPQTEPSPTFTATVITANTVTVIPTSTPSATAAATATPTLTPTAKPTLTPTATPTPVFGGYFRSIVLAKLPPAPPGPKTGEWWKNVIPTTAFEAGEDFCVVFNADKEVENVSYGIYNPEVRQYTKEKTLFSRNGTVSRGHTGCFGKVQFTKGNYEFRLWVDENLVASLAFEVKSEPVTPTPQPTATRIPQPISPLATPPTPAPAGPLTIPPTGFAIPVSQMNHEAEVSPAIADQVKIIFAYRIQAEGPHVIVSMRVYNLLRQNITELTIQECLTSGNYSFCQKPRTYSDPAGDPPRAIYFDTNSVPYLSDEDLQKYGLDWQVKIKILNMTVSMPK